MFWQKVKDKAQGAWYGLRFKMVPETRLFRPTTGPPYFDESRTHGYPETEPSKEPQNDAGWPGMQISFGSKSQLDMPFSRVIILAQTWELTK
jgi:hypothetical protein